MRKTFLFSIVLIFTGLISNAQTQFYSGTSDGSEIKAQITWKADETISGSYYFVGNSSRSYKLSGTNYIQGEIAVVESFNGRRTGSGTLVKTLTKGRIIWSGYIYNVDGTQSYFSLTRIR